jgi:hypothetical protein
MPNVIITLQPENDAWGSDFVVLKMYEAVFELSHVRHFELIVIAARQPMVAAA